MGDGAPLEPTCVSLEDWKKRWDVGRIGFHQADVTQSLVDFWAQAVSQLYGKKDSGLSVLVPLCGASRDMIWLLARPEVSRVCGIELSELALERLLSENPWLGSDPSNRRVVCPGVERWEISDGRLKFYLGDLYSDGLLSELRSSCQAVWDKGAMVAIDEDDREKYVRRVRDLCQAEHVWLMELVDYDRSKYGGPPHAIPEECVRGLLEKTHRVQLLRSAEHQGQAEKFKVPVFNIPAYLAISL